MGISRCCHLRFNFSNASCDTQLRVPLNTCASSTTFKFVYRLTQIASQRFLLFTHFQIISTIEFRLDLLEEEEAACAVRGHAEILAEEKQKLEFAKQHVSQMFHFKLNPPLLHFARIQISENIMSTGKH